eukprot:scaffold1017_cov374-Prasinococcus_capsulatus_cf.AAC.9
MSSSVTIFFLSAKSLKRLNTSFSSSFVTSYPSSTNLLPRAWRPLSFPNTRPASFFRESPIVSGDMISYVLLFFSIPS